MSTKVYPLDLDAIALMAEQINADAAGTTR
jgi:hypothetical protein